ncbi:DNA-processing protein DprA [Alkalilacustris brevis]|uniref:DNA-processing protein DprA n=1 Tax=Alkalilacustris brevis TaxID=2026338 RepID=UPI000E0DB170|nr:DNA-processing protein DprA [Alkalilacustris brevis]
MVEDLFSSPTPFTPPTTEEDRLSWLRLIRSRRVGTSTFFRLLGEYGSAAAAIEALPEIARAAGVKGYAPAAPVEVEAEFAAGRTIGAQLIAFGSPDYPAALASIPDPPPLLWALGRAELANRPAVAMVGARNASSLGTRMARSLARRLGEAGFSVVSGLARGIDAAAHGAALESGTIAVQAGGIDTIYPTENTTLAETIATQGLRLSEQPIGMAPQARHFPRRNRIISGLAHAVIVVEAAARSGSLITARDALDQGRDVMAVPGHPFDARAAGCNALIRDGATLVRGAEDVLAALEGATPPAANAPASGKPPQSAPPRETPAPAPQPPEPRPHSPSETAALHARILSQLGPSPLAEDQLIRDLSLPAAQVAPVLLSLELEGRITRQPGGLLARLA